MPARRPCNVIERVSLLSRQTGVSSILSIRVRMISAGRGLAVVMRKRGAQVGHALAVDPRHVRVHRTCTSSPCASCASNTSFLASSCAIRSLTVRGGVPSRSEDEARALELGAASVHKKPGELAALADVVSDIVHTRIGRGDIIAAHIWSAG
jgi:hypothetical protein